MSDLKLSVRYTLVNINHNISVPSLTSVIRIGIKSYERKCISRFMGMGDVLKVLKIAWAVGKCNLETFKT